MAKQTYERKVIKGFKCRISKIPHVKGSVYKSTDPERINELVRKGNVAGDEVKVREKAVEDATQKKEVETADALKHVGGGYYELPNGEKVQGKEKAEEALKNGGE